MLWCALRISKETTRKIYIFQTAVQSIEPEVSKLVAETQQKPSDLLRFSLVIFVVLISYKNNVPSANDIETNRKIV